MRFRLLLAAAAGGNQGTIDQLSPSEIEAVSTVSTVTSSLSIAGSVFIIVCYLAFKRLRKLSFTLVAILSATDVLNQFFDLVRPNADDLAAMNADPSYTSGVCYFQAIGDNFFELASVLWTTAIAATLYASVIQRVKLVDNWATLGRFAAFCYGVPLVLTIAPAIDHAYGPAGGACWILESKSYWRFISFYAPLWCAILFNIAVYARVQSLLRTTIRAAGATDATAQTIRSMMRRLNVYPVILLVVWIVPSIQEIVEASTGRQFFALSFVAFGTAGLQGTLNAFAYGFSTGVRDAIRDVVARYLPCVKDTQSLAAQTLMDGAAHGPSGSGGTAAGVPGAITNPAGILPPHVAVGGPGASGIMLGALPYSTTGAGGARSGAPGAGVVLSPGATPGSGSGEASGRALVTSYDADDDFIDDRYTHTAIPPSASVRMAGGVPHAPGLPTSPSVIVAAPVVDDV